MPLPTIVIQLEFAPSFCNFVNRAPAASSSSNNRIRMLNLSLISTTNHLLLLGNSVVNPQLPAAQFNKLLAFNRKIDYGFRNTFKNVPTNSVKTSDFVCLGLKTPQLMEEEEGEGEGEERDDAYYMRKSVDLARKAIGFTSPNPMVGCVIVKDGKIVGQGFHPKAGQPHAEVFALRDAGDLAENGTAYVSLEPCNHYGRTPPCTEALIKAKVKKVVVGMVDPNPIVASKGLDKLRDAGIEVTVGVEEELCKNLNEAYIHQMLTGNPFVTLRYSMSIDGHILDQLGDGAMEPGGYYSQLLQQIDAIAFSSRLLSTHSPIPTSKEPTANQPLRVVLGPEPQDSALCNEGNPKVVFFNEAKTGLMSILEDCKGRGLCSLMVDLRASGISDYEEVLREGMENGLFQKFVVEVCPIWGRTKGSLGTKSLLSIDEKIRVKSLITKVVGDHVLLEGYF